MAPHDLTYCVRVLLSNTRTPLGASVTAFVDERAAYTVVPEFGPFDSWEEVLTACHNGLDQQLELWSDR